VTTTAFLGLWGLQSLRDLPDLDRLEDAGLLGKPPDLDRLEDAGLLGKPPNARRTARRTRHQRGKNAEACAPPTPIVGIDRLGRESARLSVERAPVSRGLVQWIHWDSLGFG
jgi:hypothetical protein